MFLISIPYLLLRFPAKICPPTRKSKLVIVIRTTKEKDVKLVSNARLFLNLILLLPHGGRWANIYHIWSFVLLSATAEPRGWNSKLPAYSCKSIRDSGDSKGDGRYWIDPENSGNSLNVYCDMTTDGGEICSKKSEIVSNYSSFKLLFRFWLNYIPRLFFINSYHYQIERHLTSIVQISFWAGQQKAQ